MRGRTHEHEHAAHMHGKHRRKRGGKIPVASGNPTVIHEANETEDGEETERKKGGKVGKRKHHSAKAHRKAGGKIEGDHAKHRLDRHHHGHRVEGRKRGGRVGADAAPLSTANRTTGPEPLPKTEQGGMSK